MNSYMTFAIVAAVAVAVMLVASAAVTTEDAFAGKKKEERTQPSTYHKQMHVEMVNYH
jgi:hypothetical protein